MTRLRLGAEIRCRLRHERAGIAAGQQQLAAGEGEAPRALGRGRSGPDRGFEGHPATVNRGAQAATAVFRFVAFVSSCGTWLNLPFIAARMRSMTSLRDRPLPPLVACRKSYVQAPL